MGAQHVQSCVTERQCACDTTDVGGDEGLMDCASVCAGEDCRLCRSYPYTAQDGTCSLSGCREGIPHGGVVGVTDVVH